MRSRVLLGVIAWHLVLVESIREIQRYDDSPHSISNIELLIPLMVSDTSDESDTRSAGEAYERARVDFDRPFSNIPSSAFVLDKSRPTATHKHKRGHKYSRKQDLAYRPRSVYLESTESDEHDELIEPGELATDIWRACSRLSRSQIGHQHELLLLLCSELLDGSPAPPAPPAPPSPPSPPAPPQRASCSCCTQNAAPLWFKPVVRARRNFMNFGDSSHQLLSYMMSARK